MKYCEDCIYFSKQINLAKGGYSPYVELCDHPNNISERKTYKKLEKVHIKDPSELNKDNNCPWHVPKIQTFWSKLFK